MLLAMIPSHRYTNGRHNVHISAQFKHNLISAFGFWSNSNFHQFIHLLFSFMCRLVAKSLRNERKHHNSLKNTHIFTMCAHFQQRIIFMAYFSFGWNVPCNLVKYSTAETHAIRISVRCFYPISFLSTQTKRDTDIYKWDKTDNDYDNIVNMMKTCVLPHSLPQWTMLHLLLDVVWSGRIWVKPFIRFRYI